MGAKSDARLFGQFMFGCRAVMNWWMVGAELATPETLDRWEGSKLESLLRVAIRRPGCGFGRYAQAPVGYSALSRFILPISRWTCTRVVAGRLEKVQSTYCYRVAGTVEAGNQQR